MTAHVRREIAARIDATTEDQSAATLMQLAVLDHVGMLIEPTPAWGPLEFQVTVLGCTGAGDTVDTAGRDWATCALRMGEQTRAS